MTNNLMLGGGENNQKIAIISYFDVENYGDSLFPIVVKQEICNRIFCEIDFLSNTMHHIGNETTIAYNTNKITEYDAVILAGGETIHRRDHVWQNAYKNMGQLLEDGDSPSKLPFDWLKKDIGFKSWLSVGVFTPVSDAVLNEIDIALENLDFFSVRGLLAKKAVDNDFHKNTSINITPDLGWLFPRYLHDHEDVRRKLFTDLSHEELLTEPYIVVNANIPEADDLPLVCNILNELIEMGKHIILLPIVRPWDDYSVLRKVHEGCNKRTILLPNTLSLKETGSVLAGAKLYVGKSMHGAVTAMSFGNPAAVIHPFPMTKYQDLFGMSFHPEYFKNSWSELGNLIQLCDTNETQLRKEYTAYTSFMQIVLDGVFDRICKAIEQRAKNRCDPLL